MQNLASKGSHLSSTCLLCTGLPHSIHRLNGKDHGVLLVRNNARAAQREVDEACKANPWSWHADKHTQAHQSAQKQCVCFWSWMSWVCLCRLQDLGGSRLFRKENPVPSWLDWMPMHAEKSVACLDQAAPKIHCTRYRSSTT